MRLRPHGHRPGRPLFAWNHNVRMGRWRCTFLAHTRSAKKRIRQAKKRTLRNKAIRSRMRTAIRRFREALAAGDAEAVARLASQAFRAIDKAAKTGVIHANAASRRKARISRLWTEAVAR